MSFSVRKISPSIFFLISYLYFQGLEDSYNNVLIKFPDKVFLLVGLLLLYSHIGFRVSKFGAAELPLLLYALISLFSTLSGIYFIDYDPGLEDKYLPWVYMSYGCASLLLLILCFTSLKSTSYKLVYVRISRHIDLFFGFVSCTFVLALFFCLLGFDVSYGLDRSYGFPRIQGLMIEPSYAGYVFFFLFLISESRFAKTVHLICAVATLSTSFYIGFLIYFLLLRPFSTLLLGPILITSLLFYNPDFFANKFWDVYHYLVDGAVVSGNAFRVMAAFEALDFNYSLFGAGIGSSIYVVGTDSTITPNLLLFTYESGYLGVLAFSLFFGITSLRLTGSGRAAFVFIFTYGIINSGAIQLFWVGAILLRLLIVLKPIGDANCINPGELHRSGLPGREHPFKVSGLPTNNADCLSAGRH